MRNTHELLPPPTALEPLELGLDTDDGVDLRSKFRGALLGGAIGDALGRPHETSSNPRPGEDLDELRTYQPWRGWTSGPRGTITDDTQMTMCVAECILGAGTLDPEDLAKRFVAWLPVGRGKGQACVAAVTNLQRGLPWDQAGVPSAGNGAAMRVAPVGLWGGDDIVALRRDAALSAVVTHADPTAVASAVAQAFAVAYCVRRRPGSLEPAALLGSLSRVLGDLDDPPLEERRPGGKPTRLRDRINEVGEHLGESAGDAFGYFYNGAFVLESLPAALWCFLSSPEEPERVILTAVSGGFDADTVAAMAGTLAGVYHGEQVFQGEWVSDLEYASELRTLADQLWEGSKRRHLS